MQHNGLRACAVRRPFDALRLLQLLGQIGLASSIGGYHLEVPEEAEHNLLAVLNVDAARRSLVALQRVKKTLWKEHRVAINLDDPIAVGRELLVADVQPSLVEHHA